MKTDEAMHAVREDRRALQFIENQTEEMCWEAIRQNGYALGYVKEQTKEMCLAAVKSHNFALFFVDEQTDEICLAAVKEDDDALQYVKNKTKEIRYAALKQYVEYVGTFNAVADFFKFKYTLRRIQMIKTIKAVSAVILLGLVLLLFIFEWLPIYEESGIGSALIFTACLISAVVCAVDTLVNLRKK